MVFILRRPAIRYTGLDAVYTSPGSAKTRWFINHLPSIPIGFSSVFLSRGLGTPCPTVAALGLKIIIRHMRHPLVARYFRRSVGCTFNLADDEH